MGRREGKEEERKERRKELMKGENTRNPFACLFLLIKPIYSIKSLYNLITTMHRWGTEIKEKEHTPYISITHNTSFPNTFLVGTLQSTAAYHLKPS